MRTIISEISTIASLLGEQKTNNDAIYRLMSFCIILPIDSDVLIYNNLTKELLLLDNSEFLLLKNGNKIYPGNTIVDLLVKKWFLVPCDYDETKLSDQVTSIVKKLNINNGISVYDILTTTTCNARCFYCFEAGVKPVSMSDSTADAVADYIIKNYNNKNVHIKWFGGEPLCNTSAINIISKKLRRNNIIFNSEMTTNGYLFDKNLVLSAKNIWNLKQVQITLDGTKDLYNKIKNYKNNDQNPFEHVIRNIGMLLNSEIGVKIRLNFDFYNEKDLYLLIDYLYKFYGSKERFSVYCHMIFSAGSYKNNLRTSEHLNDLGDRLLKIQDYIFNIGLSGKLRLSREIKINNCMADSMNSVMITPEGNLGRCEHHINDDFYGTIFEDVKRQPWSDYKEREQKCNKCALYPTCIRLKRCRTDEKQCYEYRQKQAINNIKHAMIYEYKKYFENENKE